MKNWVSYLGALILLAAANVALAHNGSVTISSPINSQTIVVESLPINIIVEGTISHNSPGNINNQKACVIVDGGTPNSEPSYVGDLGSMSSRGFSITVPVGTEGPAYRSSDHGQSRGQPQRNFHSHYVLCGIGQRALR